MSWGEGSDEGRGGGRGVMKERGGVVRGEGGKEVVRKGRDGENREW